MTSKGFRDRLEGIIDGFKSQRAFAIFIDAPPPVVNEWINKGYFPGEQYLTALRDKLNININWLITGIGPRYLTATDRVKEEEAGYIPHGHTREEREYAEKLVKIMRTKMDGTVLAIKQNIDAFLTTPDKEEEVKKIAKAG